MAYREIPLISGEIYHVFNRSIARQPIFTSSSSNSLALELINYYQYQDPSLRYSYFKRLTDKAKRDYFNLLCLKNVRVEIYAYCLMPNHYHFLVKQKIDDGISKFISQFQNSFAKYTNLKTDRTGGLFQANFKAIRIETEEQLIHTARYIHLNPLTDYVIKTPTQLPDYKWNSFQEYISENFRLVGHPTFLMNFYKSIFDFEKFTLDQLEYQRSLAEIKHLTHDHTSEV